MGCSPKVYVYYYSTCYKAQLTQKYSININKNIKLVFAIQNRIASSISKFQLYSGQSLPVQSINIHINVEDKNYNLKIERCTLYQYMHAVYIRSQ